jgi:ethanolamine permease
LAIRAYLNVQFSSVDPKLAAVGAYVVFMALNIVGGAHRRDVRAGHHCDRHFELLVFMGVVCPAFQANFTKGGWSGRTASAWRPFPASSPPSVRDLVFLAIEGVAMAAENAKPQALHSYGLSAGILLTLVLAIGVMLFAGGAGTGPNWPTSTTRYHKP